MDMKTDPTLLNEAGQQSRETTYADLIAFFHAEEAPQMGAQQVRNRVSALNRLLEHLNKTAESAIGLDLSDGVFPKMLSNFDAASKEAGVVKSTLANIKTDLRRWKGVYDAWVALKSMPEFEGFAAALRYYLERAQATGKISLRYRVEEEAGFKNHSNNGEAGTGWPSTANCRLSSCLLADFENTCGASWPRPSTQ